MKSPLDKAHVITSKFGMRTLAGVTSMHNGIDLCPQDGKHPTDIVAVCDGTVTYKVSNLPDGHTGLNVSNNAAGNCIYYKTDDGYRIQYHHLKADSICVNVNQRVQAGDKIGVMGTTGKSTGVHLHYEIRNPAGNPVDPLPYLDNGLALPVVQRSKPILRNGNKGSDIKNMQELLLKAGFQLPRWGADGSFGEETLTALRAFQTAHKLVVDGICGPLTWGALGKFA